MNLIFTAQILGRHNLKTAVDIVDKLSVNFQVRGKIARLLGRLF